MRLRQSRVLSLVGLATKAGRTVSGEFSTEKAVKTGEARLVIVSEEASDNTKKKFQNMCAYYKVRFISMGRRMSWEGLWARSSGLPLPFSMRALAMR